MDSMSTHAREEARGTAPLPAPTVADLHDGPECDSCGKSLMRCGACGRYADEHVPSLPKFGCDCPAQSEDEHEWYTEDTWPILTHHATRLDPDEYAEVCRRCAPPDPEDDDGPEDDPEDDDDPLDDDPWDTGGDRLDD